jgi:hypothetical protein
MKRKRKSLRKESKIAEKSLSEAASQNTAITKIYMNRDYLLLGIALALAAVLAFAGLTNHPFWDDEANTAIIGRNLLKTGHFSAWDGVNVLGYRLGAELDENLNNIYAPPLQHFIAAAGIWLFGETTFGGRIIFVVAGLLALIPLFFWTRWHLRDRVPPWVPAFLVALSPAYLMYIRQCRYYAFAMLFTVVILAAFSFPKTVRRSTLCAIITGGFAAVLLMLTNYLCAVALAGVLPLFILLKRYRHKQQYLFLGSIYAAFFIAGMYILSEANPFTATVIEKGEITGLARFGTLLWWHLIGLGPFEFFPVLVPAFLIILLAIKPFENGRPLVLEGLFIVFVMCGYIVFTVFFTPQPIFRSLDIADMRYVVPLILIGAGATACVIQACWNYVHILYKTIAVVILVLAVTSNILCLGFIDEQPVTSTIFKYIRENLNPYVTGSESLIGYLRSLPEKTIVEIDPSYLTNQSQFYAPKLHYCCQLRPDRPIRADIRAELPEYVFIGSTRPDYIFAGKGRYSPAAALAYFENKYGAGTYRIKEILSDDWRDLSRPEIPLHSFGPPGESGFGGPERGFAVLERIR